MVKNNHKRLLSIVLICLFAILFLTASLYLQQQADHNCTGTDCAICSNLSFCTRQFSNSGNAAVIRFWFRFAAAATIVYSVAENSPAAQAGLQANDIISAANGEKITSASDLTAFVKKLSAGDELKLTVSRSGQETTLTVIVGEKQQDANPQTNEDQSGYRQYSDGSDSFNDFSDFFGGFPFGYSGGYSGGYSRG